MKAFVSGLLLICILFCMVGCNLAGHTGSHTDALTDESEVAQESTEIETEEVGVESIVPQDEAYIKWFGRIDKLKDGSVGFDYTASGFEVKFRGSRLAFTLDSTEYSSDTYRAYVTVIIDGEDYRTADYYALDEQNKLITLDLSEGVHTVRVLKRSEAMRSRAFLKNIDTDGVFLKSEPRRDRYIEFYGDSITCGYGNMSTDTNTPFKTETEDGLATYAFITAETLGAECSVISQSGIAINKNVYEDTLNLPMLAGRTSFTDTTPYKSECQPDAVVIYGGVNDKNYLLATSDTAERAVREQAFVDSYASFLTDILMRNPDVAIFCCSNLYSEGLSMGMLIKKAIEKVGSDNVYYVSLTPKNPDDGIGSQGHPTYKSHEIAADDLTAVIKQKMNWQ